MPKRILVTGGAGFIGVNTVAHLVGRGDRVTVVDNLSRRGSEANLTWLQSRGPLAFHQADLRDEAAVAEVVAEASPLDAVIHLAGQTAVTTSVADPRSDFTANLLGTFNLLEAIRQSGAKPVMLLASTNKVYGSLESLGISETDTRYRFAEYPHGVDENQPLDFHSPYGCSKGGAEQYWRDYHRIYGLRTVVFRQGCIYGPRQFGVEDQGWVAWFVVAALCHRPVTVYGDGRQVRDLLHVSDLVALYCRAIDRIHYVAGDVFNVGGGPDNARSILEVLRMLRDRVAPDLTWTLAPARPGDQRVYIADIRKVRAALDWFPTTDAEAGLQDLVRWVRQHRDQITTTLGFDREASPTVPTGRS